MTGFLRGALAPLGVTLIALAAAFSAQASSAQAASSGPYITYLRDSASSAPSVWLANANGSGAHKLAAGGSSLVAANGATVAVARVASGGSALALYSTGGRLERGYFDASKVSATPLAWSADSRYLAVSLLSTAVSGAGSALVLIDAKTLVARTVATGVIYGASFNPAGDVLAFARAGSQRTAAPVNLYAANTYGGPAVALTSDGRSLYPLWVRSGIVFDRETLRGKTSAPAYQLWLKSGSKLRRLTDLKIPVLLDGLVPLDASANGNRILASYQGEDTENAWTVQLSPLRVTQVLVGGRPVQPGAISRNGQQLLIDVGGFDQPSDEGTVESLGFAGGAAVKLARGAAPSWNR